MTPIKKLVQIPEVSDGTPIHVDLETFRNSRLCDLPDGTTLRIIAPKGPLVVMASIRMLLASMSFHLGPNKDRSSAGVFIQALNHAVAFADAGKTQIFSTIGGVGSDPALTLCQMHIAYKHGTPGAEILEDYEYGLNHLMREARHVLQATSIEINISPHIPVVIKSERIVTP